MSSRQKKLLVLALGDHIKAALSMTRNFKLEEGRGAFLQQRQFPKTGTFRRRCSTSELVLMKTLIAKIDVSDESEDVLPSPRGHVSESSCALEDIPPNPQALEDISPNPQVRANLKRLFEDFDNVGFPVGMAKPTEDASPIQEPSQAEEYSADGILVPRSTQHVCPRPNGRPPAVAKKNKQAKAKANIITPATPTKRAKTKTPATPSPKAKTKTPTTPTPTRRAKTKTAATPTPPAKTNDLILSRPCLSRTKEGDPRCELCAMAAGKRIHVKSCKQSSFGSHMANTFEKVAKMIEAGGMTKAKCVDVIERARA